MSLGNLEENFLSLMINLNIQPLFLGLLLCYLFSSALRKLFRSLTAPFFCKCLTISSRVYFYVIVSLEMSLHSFYSSLFFVNSYLFLYFIYISLVFCSLLIQFYFLSLFSPAASFPLLYFSCYIWSSVFLLFSFILLFSLFLSLLNLLFFYIRLSFQFYYFTSFHLS